MDNSDRKMAAEAPITLSSPAAIGSCFTDGGNWKPSQVLAVLDCLFHVPCLYECILGAQIDSSCPNPEINAILELQDLFDRRAKTRKGKNLIPVDQLTKALAIARPGEIKNRINENNPVEIFQAIFGLIISTLPELREIFFGGHMRDRFNSKKLNGINIRETGLMVDIDTEKTLDLEECIRENNVLLSRLSESLSPLLTITAQYEKGSGSKDDKKGKAAFSFPSILHFTRHPSNGSSGVNLIYQLQSMIVEPPPMSDGGLQYHTYFRSGGNFDWHASGPVPQLIPESMVDSAAMSDSGVKVWVLIYIRADLPDKLNQSSAGFPEKIEEFENRQKRMYEDDGSAPMDEESDPDEDYEDVDDEDDDEDDDDDYYDDEDDDYDDEYESNAQCQCPTCRRDRSRDQERMRMEIEALEKAKREAMRRQMIPRGPGTKSVAFHPTVLEDAERILIEGRFVYRDCFLNHITGMEGYMNRSQEELRFEDYCEEKPALMKVKKRLDAEITDRLKEALTRQAMNRDETAMRLWLKASDKAWAEYTEGIAHMNGGNKEKAIERFSAALRCCFSGPHLIGSWFNRAQCYKPRHLALALSDLESVVSADESHAQAHYEIGSILVSMEKDWEDAEEHLVTAMTLDATIFDEEDRKSKLKKATEQAAHIRVVNKAEALKTEGNNMLAQSSFTRAEALYSEAIELCPDGEKSHIYYCNRAAARCEIGIKLSATPDEGKDVLQSAIEDCEASLQLQPSYAKASFRQHFCTGALHFLQDKLADSLKSFNSALELDPTNALVKQEVRKVSTAIEVVKAKERTAEIEKEMAEREALRAEEAERERKLLAEKRARDEQIKKEKAEKAEADRAERARLKAEKEAAKVSLDYQKFTWIDARTFVRTHSYIYSIKETY
jgi:hypothetical protein